MSGEVELNIPRTAEERLAAQSDWKCSGCGVRSPGRVRSCTCPTGVVWRKDPETNRDAYAWKIEAGLSESDPARELLASWMISHGYATGHGDTIEDLLGELEGQIEPFRDGIIKIATFIEPHWLGANSVTDAYDPAKVLKLVIECVTSLSADTERMDDTIDRMQADITRKDEALRQSRKVISDCMAGSGAPRSEIEAALLPIRAALHPLAPGSKSFQDRVGDWLLACFGAEISNDKQERNHRFLEEALELVQACGCTQSEAHQLVDYVFDRPVGEDLQEVGGVMVTLAALCRSRSIQMDLMAERELARVWTKVETIRAKQAAKPKHSPLPAAPGSKGDAS